MKKGFEKAKSNSDKNTMLMVLFIGIMTIIVIICIENNRSILAKSQIEQTSIILKSIQYYENKQRN